jgi:hypothetical protein
MHKGPDPERIITSQLMRQVYGAIALAGAGLGLCALVTILFWGIK